MTKHRELTYSGSKLEELAKEAAGNYQKFDSFASWAEYDNEDDWCIVYTSNRDSGLMEQSNAQAIEKEMEVFMDAGMGKCCGAVDEDGDPLPDVRAERHSHWAVGHVDGYAIRVYGPNREVTQAFKQWCDIQAMLEHYPIFDEEDYSKRELEATHENIEQQAEYTARKFSDRMPEDFEFPEDYVHQMWKYFWDYDQGAIENQDDQGGYPSEDECFEAFQALGWTNPEMEDGVLTMIALSEDADREQWHFSIYRPDGGETYIGKRAIDTARYHIWKNEAGFDPFYLAQRE